MAASAAAAIQVAALGEPPCQPYCEYPLAISSARVAAPVFHPVVRSTLVAPVFPLPDARISAPVFDYGNQTGWRRSDRRPPGQEPASLSCGGNSESLVYTEPARPSTLSRDKTDPPRKAEVRCDANSKR
jgi:hypothetical protein